MINKRTWEIHNKDWGKELWLENNSLYCGKILILNKSWQCSYHKHDRKTETFTVLSGRVILIVGNECTLLESSDCVTLPKKTWHSFIGVDSTNVIVESSTPHSDDDVTRSTQTKWLCRDAFQKYLKAVGIKKPSDEDRSASSTSPVPPIPKRLDVSHSGRRNAGNPKKYFDNGAGKAVAAHRDGRSKRGKGGRGSASASPSGSKRKPRRSNRGKPYRSSPVGDMLL
jgi:mannose-6-phosphate isomerase-like protein (cupin superfamily)